VATPLEWNERYRASDRVFEPPTPLVVEYSRCVAPGVALDLASGPGRNSLYLAECGWHVTAVDGSQVAIELLRARNPSIDARLLNLERDEFAFSSATYDLILSCYYLQRSLIPRIKSALRPGGLLIMIVLLADPGQPHGTPIRAYPGELGALFSDWAILHYREGEPSESGHRHAVAELVATKP
jgi:SAM-dependent methyltransferase